MELPDGISRLSSLYKTFNLVSFGSGNGLAPLRHPAITWTSAGLLSIGLLGTNFSEIWIRILSFSLKKMDLKLLSAKMAAILSSGRLVNNLQTILHISPVVETLNFSSCSFREKITDMKAEILLSQRL